eukprot:scaffold49987_cov19-Tisochrysis_lutea.AAC.1
MAPCAWAAPRLPCSSTWVGWRAILWMRACSTHSCGRRRWCPTWRCWWAWRRLRPWPRAYATAARSWATGELGSGSSSVRKHMPPVLAPEQQMLVACAGHTSSAPLWVGAGENARLWAYG